MKEINNEAQTEATTAAQPIPFSSAPKTTAEQVRDFIAERRATLPTTRLENVPSFDRFTVETVGGVREREVLAMLEEATKATTGHEKPREPLTRAETMKEVKKAYRALEVLNNIDWTNHRDELHRQCAEEEKKHRNFMGRDTRPAITTPDAAKLFAVRRIAEYLTGESSQPDTRFYISMQKSCFYAASLVANYRQQIATAFHADGINVETLLSADYARLVDPETK